MKKIYYLLAFISVVSFSCKPLSKTYSDIDATPLAANSTINLTLTSPDYKILPSTVYAYSGLYFKSATDANVYIPTILTAKYPTVQNLIAVSATFNLAPSSSNIAVPDSTYSRVAFTLAAADYVYPSYVSNGNTIAGNTLADFSTTTAINYLGYKYPTPSPNQMVVLNYLYFESGITAAAGTQTTDTYLYLGGSWTKVYTISAAQYASVNRGVNNWFLATDVPNLVYYVNSILKGDPTIMATAKAGDVKYISYRYTTTYQKILTLTYDGTNWVSKQTLSFLKVAGVWLPDPTVIVNEPVGVNADYSYLNTLTIGTAAARSNLASFGDFNISSVTSTSYWSDADITAAFAAILLHRITAPVVGIPYRVNYFVYTGATVSASKVYQYNGTAFVLQ